MGWASGSEVGDDIWNGIRDLILPENRQEAARVVIDALEDADCDTIYECEQLVKDAGLEDKYWPEEEEDGE